MFSTWNVLSTDVDKYLQLAIKKNRDRSKQLSAERLSISKYKIKCYEYKNTNNSNMVDWSDFNKRHCRLFSLISF